MANNRKQVSLSGAAGNGKKKKPISWKKVKGIAYLVLTLVVVVALVIAGNAIFNQEKGPQLSSEEMVPYTVTPQDVQNKVSYFALGVTGDKLTDRMEMVAVMCFDRKENTISVVQVPVNTYLGKKNGFATSAIGDVWKKPQPIQFCSLCRLNVPEDEIEKKKHTVCGGKIEKQIGSASADLCRVFNEQYGLPIDNFLVIPHSGLAELIDGLGGVDVKLSKSAKLGGKNYKAGVRTLTGDAAVAYATKYSYSGSVDSDRERMIRQRQVFAALIQRFSTSELEDLYGTDEVTGATKGVIGKLMISEHPVRFNTTAFGKARLLNTSMEKVDSMKLSDALARFALRVGEVPLENITFSILPGYAATEGTGKYYSVNQKQAIDLLNDQMNPYGLTLDKTTVKVPKLSSSTGKVNLKTKTLDKIAQPQTGDLNEEE